MIDTKKGQESSGLKWLLVILLIAGIFLAIALIFSTSFRDKIKDTMDLVLNLFGP